MCPYCGCNQFQNSWGSGNAVCCQCKREFNVTFVDGQLVGTEAGVVPTVDMEELGRLHAEMHKDIEENGPWPIYTGDGA